MHQQPAPAGRSQRQEAEPEPRTTKDPGTTVTLGMSRQVKLQAANDRDAVVQFQRSLGFGHQFKLQVQHRCSSSRIETLGRGTRRSGGVLPLLCRQPRRGGVSAGPTEIPNYARGPRVRHNPSLKRSANGRPPGPVWRYAVHFRQPGPGVLPLSPA